MCPRALCPLSFSQVITQQNMNFGIFNEWNNRGWWNNPHSISHPSHQHEQKIVFRLLNNLTCYRQSTFTWDILQRHCFFSTSCGGEWTYWLLENSFTTPCWSLRWFCLSGFGQVVTDSDKQTRCQKCLKTKYFWIMQTPQSIHLSLNSYFTTSSQASAS